MNFRNVLKLALVFSVAFYFATMSYVYFKQTDLQFSQDMTIRSPQQMGTVGIEEIKLQTPDGETLYAWYKPAPSARPTILFFHGNSGNISSRPGKIMRYGQNNGILAISYRGMGGSTGAPSEKGFMIDAQTGYDWLLTNGVEPSQMILLGESLGTGVAVQLAAKNPVRAVGLEAPYASAIAIAANTYWYFPVNYLMKDQFRTIEFIDQVKAPIFITHGTEDRIVPYADSQMLFAKANEPKTFVSVPNAGHEIIADEKTWATVHQFFEDVWNTPSQ